MRVSFPNPDVQDRRVSRLYAGGNDEVQAEGGDTYCLSHAYDIPAA